MPPHVAVVRGTSGAIPVVLVVAVPPVPTQDVREQAVLTVPDPEAAARTPLPVAVSRIADQMLCRGHGFVGGFSEIELRQLAFAHIGQHIDDVDQGIVENVRLGGQGNGDGFRRDGRCCFS